MRASVGFGSGFGGQRPGGAATRGREKAASGAGWKESWFGLWAVACVFFLKSSTVTPEPEFLNLETAKN